MYQHVAKREDSSLEEVAETADGNRSSPSSWGYCGGTGSPCSNYSHDQSSWPGFTHVVKLLDPRGVPRNVILALYVCLNIALVVCILSGFLLNVMGYELGSPEAAARPVSALWLKQKTWGCGTSSEATNMIKHQMVEYSHNMVDVFIKQMVIELVDFIQLHRGLASLKPLAQRSLWVSVWTTACTWLMPTTKLPGRPPERSSERHWSS